MNSVRGTESVADLGVNVGVFKSSPVRGWSLWIVGAGLSLLPSCWAGLCLASPAKGKLWQALHTGRAAACMLPCRMCRLLMHEDQPRVPPAQAWSPGPAWCSLRVGSCRPGAGLGPGHHMSVTTHLLPNHLQHASLPGAFLIWKWEKQRWIHRFIVSFTATTTVVKHSVQCLEELLQQNTLQSNG